MKTDDIIPSEIIEKRIFLIRGQKVMLDSHLAELYNVPTKSLNLAVKRNSDRFPSDFMFQLTEEEYLLISDHLRFQSETSKQSGRQFQIVFDAIRQILTPPEKPKRGIGFHVDEPVARYKAKKDAAR